MIVQNVRHTDKDQVSREKFEKACSLINSKVLSEVQEYTNLRYKLQYFSSAFSLENLCNEDVVYDNRLKLDQDTLNFINKKWVNCESTFQKDFLNRLLYPNDNLQELDFVFSLRTTDDTKRLKRIKISVGDILF